MLLDIEDLSHEGDSRTRGQCADAVQHNRQLVEVFTNGDGDGVNGDERSRHDQETPQRREAVPVRRHEQGDARCQQDGAEDQRQQHLPAQARRRLALRFELPEAFSGGSVEQTSISPALQRVVEGANHVATSVVHCAVRRKRNCAAADSRLPFRSAVPHIRCCTLAAPFPIRDVLKQKQHRTTLRSCP